MYQNKEWEIFMSKTVRVDKQNQREQLTSKDIT